MDMLNTRLDVCLIMAECVDNGNKGKLFCCIKLQLWFFLFFVPALNISSVIIPLKSSHEKGGEAAHLGEGGWA